MPKILADSNTKNLLILHLTVFIWGFTAILGALISIDAIRMTWYRVLIAIFALSVYFFVRKTSVKVSPAKFFQFVFTGALVALHWIFFFHAIKISTVSVTLVCLSSITLFTSILEPLMKKQAIQISDVVVGIIIIMGICLIFKFETQYTVGIVVGLSAAVSVSIFNTINSKLVQKTDATIIGFYELFGAFFWITLYRLFDHTLLIETFQLNTQDWLCLIILGSICTALAYIAGVSVMRTLSAFQVALITNLEPVYGIILAFIFFGSKEKMSTGFYIGALLILGAIFLYPVYKRRVAVI